MINSIRQRSLVAPLGVLLAGVGFLALAAEDGPTICPFALGTGVACPGCGMTRGIAALIRGDLAGSWRLHPLATLAALEITVAWTWWAWRRSGRTDRTPGTLTQFALGLTAVLLVAVWVVRLAGGTLPPV